MRKLVLALVLLVLAGGGVAVFGLGNRAHTPLSVLLNPDARKVAELGRQFLESVQYKDFKSAAQLSLPEDREKADIPALIERMFQVKPELLDINKIELLSADVDSTGNRARTKMVTDIKLLNTNELRHPEVMLYWQKKEGRWYMDLASSLK